MVKTVKVTAPSDMNEGYRFQVEINGQTIPVTVPAGGVNAGQVFEVPVSPEHASLAIACMGRWRHGIFDCFGVFCNTMFFCGWCCLPILLGQVMQRMGLNCFGCKTSSPQWTCCWVTLMYIVIVAIMATLNALYLPQIEQTERIYQQATEQFLAGNMTADEYNQVEAPKFGPGGRGFLFYQITSFLFIIFYVAHCCLRNKVRERFSIPSDCCGMIGDCLCTWFCACCSMIQIARHTHDEYEHPYSCFSPTGLSPDAPLIV